jgi:8-oxo-dGTP pyrophosphatase MutT (NUDIX family)
MTIKWIVGILNRDDRVLIAKLRNKNLLIPRMQWMFPYTLLKEEESPRKAIQRLFLNELGLGIEVGRFILKYTPSENPKIEQYFYDVKFKAGNVINSKEFSEFSWILPNQIMKYFTTSVSRDLMDYLNSLAKKGEGMIFR